MAPPLVHDYIGLSPNSDKLSPSAGSGEPAGNLVAGTPAALLNLKATELRLGLPGSESPDRMDGAGLTLGLPSNSKSSASGAKRGFSDAINGSVGKWVFTGESETETESGKSGGQRSGPAGAGKDVGGAGTESGGAAPAAKAQVVGWPPIRNYRKNTMAANPSKNKEDAEGNQGLGCMYVKVSMDGAPYLRKVDLKMYPNYKELSSALENMFSCFTIGQCGSHGLAGRDVLSESRLIDLLHGSECVLTYEDKDGDWMLVGDVPWDMFTETCRRLRIMKGSDAIGIAPRAVEKSKNRN